MCHSARNLNDDGENRNTNSVASSTTQIHSNRVRSPLELSNILQKICGDQDFSVEMRNDVYFIRIKGSKRSDGVVNLVCIASRSQWTIHFSFNWDTQTPSQKERILKIGRNSRNSLINQRQ